jgi:SAM-dependent methyltransferase
MTAPQGEPSEDAASRLLAHSAAAERNKAPILEVLRHLLGPRGTALEIASGTGQHVAWFAAALQDWTWQPTDADAGMLPAIAARIAQDGLANVRPPRLLDVTAAAWPSPEAPFAERFDAIFCANMLHIAPWSACPALMRGAARHLAPGGVLVTYGPYFEHDVPAAPSNLAFDESLRARNPAWGIRRLQDVTAEAQGAGLALAARHAMPANNLLLAFRRAGDARTAPPAGWSG